MLYGADLIRNGWNRTFVPDTDKDQSHTLANVLAFKLAAIDLDRLIRPSDCEPGQ